VSVTAAHLLLYFIFALGGAGIYFLLPRGDRPKVVVGAILGLSAVIAFIIVLATHVMSSDPAGGYFYVFATIALVAAARVITHSKPVYSAVYFVLVVVAVAAMLVLLHAEFVAIALIIIYAGAIMVTYLFVIMLARQPGSPIYDRRAREPFLAVLAGFVLMAAVAGRAGDMPERADRNVPVTLTASDEPVPMLPDSNTLAVGATVMTKYVVALEIAGMLLLIAMVGAIALSKKKVPTDGHRPEPVTLGVVGKEVPPY
jgi:NADH-quinone oxidoreductase subunit J